MIPIIAEGFLGIEHFTPPWDVFFLPLFNLLLAFYRLLFSDFALAIIVFTVVIRTVLAPLFVRQIRSQKEMQRMQPLIREVQRKHKGNRAKIQEETMALYKEHGVNPAAGCLPVVLQLPILFALYQALIRASNVVTLAADKVKSTDFAQLKTALPGITSIDATHFRAPIDGPCTLPQFSLPDFTHFLPLNCQLINPLQLHQPIITKIGWLGGLDLAQIDHVFAVLIPGTGFALSFLAVTAAVLQFVQVKMTSPLPNPDDPTSSLTSSMTYTFPLLTVVWGGIFPSGLILYWIVYTAYLVTQQFLIMGWGNLFPIFGWRPPFAPAPASALVAGQRRQLATVREEAGPARQSNPRPDRANAGRSANRRSGGRKARGRKR